MTSETPDPIREAALPPRTPRQRLFDLNHQAHKILFETRYPNNFDQLEESPDDRNFAVEVDKATVVTNEYVGENRTESVTTMQRMRIQIPLLSIVTIVGTVLYYLYR